MSEPTGWLPDPPASTHELELGASYLESLLERAPSSGSMLPREPWRQLQNEESCSGRVGVGLVYELTGEKGSAECLWYWARRYTQGRDVRNTGVSIAAIRWAYSRFGTCAAVAWNPQTPGFALVGETAKPHALTVLKTRKLDFAPLYGSGVELIDAAAIALDLGMPVAYVVGAGGEFNEQRDGVVARRTESRSANHIVYARGHRTRGGARQFYTANTWIGWGDGVGAAWVDESWLAASAFTIIGRGVS